MLALLAVVSPAAPASAKPKGKHHVFTFGSRNLARGTKGKDVRFLQRALTRLGVATSIDGVFGKGTFKSVEAFQAQHGCPVNGVVSRKDAGRIKKLLAEQQISGSYFVEGYTLPTLTVTARHPGNTKVKILAAADMHLQAPSWAPAGTSAYAGQQIGRIGNTGDAEGSHLHFERWSAPGW